MNSNETAAFKTLEQAQQALKSGDRAAARDLAGLAAQLAPELEEVWLLMAALASPQDSLAHLQRALQINPQSERALKGIAWAKKRLAQDSQAGMATEINLPATPPTVQSTAVAETLPQVVPETRRVDETNPAKINQPAAETQSAEIAAQGFQTRTVEPAPVELPGSITQPRKTPVTEPAPVPDPVGPPPNTRSKDARALPRYSYLALLGVFICLVLAWLAWQGVQPVAAFFSSSAFTGQEHGPAWSQVNIAKPVLTPNSDGIVAVPTATELTPADSTPTGIVSTEITPTATPVPQTETPASVAVVMPTDTPLVQPTIQQAVVIQPTATSSPLPLPSPTENIPAPTLPPAPTATLAAIATAAPGSTLVADAGASPTPLPTDTGVPFATPKAPGSSMAASAPGTGHWVDVDLTNQMVYAYDGNTVVNSFLVSTGTWAHPTVTGQYHVYVKYRYTDMSGPGYYLPNVPFTMYFYQGYALHGTYWHSNFGTPMSHGCVNLSIPDSEWLYNFSSVGTLVNVHY